MTAADTTARPDALESLSGLVERVTFHNAESGFAVLQVKVRGHKDLVPVLGTLPEVKAGEWIEAQGRWVIDREYGRQFRTIRLCTAPPTTAEGMKKYLASGLIKGIGPAFAGRLGLIPMRSAQGGTSCIARGEKRPPEAAAESS